MALPSAIWGAAFALAISGDVELIRMPSAAGMAGGALTIACLVALVLLKHPVSMLDNLSGVGVILLALLPWKSDGASHVVRWTVNGASYREFNLQ